VKYYLKEEPIQKEEIFTNKIIILKKLIDNHFNIIDKIINNI